MDNIPSIDDLLNYGDEYQYPELITSDYFRIDNTKNNNNSQQPNEKFKKQDYEQQTDEHSEQQDYEQQIDEHSKQQDYEQQINEHSEQQDSKQQIDEHSEQQDSKQQSDEHSEKQDSKQQIDERSEQQDYEQQTDEHSEQHNYEQQIDEHSEQQNSEQQIDEHSEKQDYEQQIDEYSEQQDSKQQIDEHSKQQDYEQQIDERSEQQDYEQQTDEHSEQHNYEQQIDEHSKKQDYEQQTKDENNFDDLMDNYDESNNINNETNKINNSEKPSNKLDNINTTKIYKVLRKLVSLSYERYQKGTYKYNKKEIVKHYLTKQKFRIIDDLASPVFKPDVYVFDLSPSNNESLEMYVNAISSVAIKNSLIYLTYNDCILRKLVIKKENLQGIDVSKVANSQVKKYNNFNCTIFNEYRSLYEELKDIKDRKIYIFSDFDISSNISKLSQENQDIVWFSTEKNNYGYLNYGNDFYREYPSTYIGYYVETSGIDDIEKFILEKNKNKYKRRSK